MIAADKNRYRLQIPSVLAWFCILQFPHVRHVGHGLDVLVRRDLEELGNVGDSAFAGRVNQLRFTVTRGRELWNRRQLRGRLLQIGRVAAAWAAYDQVLAGVGVDHELVRLRAAHGAGVRLDDHVLQSTTVEDSAVSVVMLAIANVEPGGIDVEGVRILHGELADAQKARFRTRLVAELLLDLVPDLWKLLVAAQLLARDLGHDFFLRHAEAEVAPAAVFQTKHAVAHHLPAAARLPNFARVQGGQIELLSDAVHLLADDLGYAHQSAVAEKQE